jgi:hypothetical protein
VPGIRWAGAGRQEKSRDAGYYPLYLHRAASSPSASSTYILVFGAGRVPRPGSLYLLAFQLTFAVQEPRTLQQPAASVRTAISGVKATHRYRVCEVPSAPFASSDLAGTLVYRRTRSLEDYMLRWKLFRADQHRKR